ncbi:MAG: hypothetical protein NVS3B1_02060 [Marmoricola sp.]
MHPAAPTTSRRRNRGLTLRHDDYLGDGEMSGVPSRAERIRKAQQVGDSVRDFQPTEEAQARSREWLRKLDPKAMVGARHHTVPRFILERWATADQVQTYSKAGNTYRTANIKDLAWTDFYTFIDQQGEKDSSMESLLGMVEGEAAEVINRLLNPLFYKEQKTDQLRLAQLAAFQLCRTMRFRKQTELQAEWFVKTRAQGQIPPERLEGVTVVPHQNTSVQMLTLGTELTPMLLTRPLAVLRLDAKRLLIGDEPVVVNDPQDGGHHDHCFMTDEQIRESQRIRARKDRKKQGPGTRGRIIHFRPTAAKGVGVALEVFMPIAPDVVLAWGPLVGKPKPQPIIHAQLNEEESIELANSLNDVICTQALDWVVSRTDDAAFSERSIPEPGPLVVLCGPDYATASINQTPKRLRPTRLWPVEAKDPEKV